MDELFINYSLPFVNLWRMGWLLCSVTQLCLTLCNAMDCSMPGFRVLHHLLEFAQTHVHWVSDAIQPSHPLSPPFPASGSFPMSQFFTSGDQSIDASTPAQSFQWIFRVGFLKYWLIWSPCCPRNSSRVFSSITVRKYQFFKAQPSLWSNSHTHTWLLEKP